MMVVGNVNGLKIREGHWTSKDANGKGRLLLKLDEQPKNFTTAEIGLKYGPSTVPVTVKYLEWNDNYNTALVEILSGY